MSSTYANRDRLPTLFEVLNRLSSPPVDLWSFYVFMRENYKGVEYLDFWLEAANHSRLWRRYMRAQKYTSDAQVLGPDGAPQPQNIQHQRLSDSTNPRTSSNGSNQRSSGGTPGRDGRKGSPSSSMLFTMLNEGVTDSEAERRYSGANSSGPSSGHRASRATSSGVFGTHIEEDDNIFDDAYGTDGDGEAYYHQQQQPHHQQQETGVPDDSGSFVYTSAPNSPDVSRNENNGLPPVPPSRAHHRRSSTSSHLLAGMEIRPVPRSGPGIVPGNEYARVPGGTPPDGSVRSSSESDGNRSPLQGPITREQLHASVDRIVKTYFTPGGSREIALPGSMSASIRLAAQGRGKDNAMIFDEAREYVFDALEREAYPAFLAKHALANIQSRSSLVRLLVGLIGLFGAFWIGFVFIFLNWTPRAQRCWVILPFGVGWYLVFSSLYNLDPLLGLFGVTETGKFGLARIGEPYVRQLVFKRSLFALAITLFIAACFVVLFVFVPGHRL